MNAQTVINRVCADVGESGCINEWRKFWIILSDLTIGPTDDDIMFEMFEYTLIISYRAGSAQRRYALLVSEPLLIRIYGFVRTSISWWLRNHQSSSRIFCF